MNSKDIKVIFADIDWTLLNHEDGHVYDNESILALKKAQEKGVKIVLATSRPFHSVRDIGAIDLIKADGYIFSNSGYVLFDNKTLYVDSIPELLIERVVELTKDLDCTLECIQKDHHFIVNPLIPIVDELFKTYYESTPKIEDYHNKDIIACLLFLRKEDDEKILPFFPTELKYYRFTDYAVDIVYNHHEKGDGVKLILEHLGLTKDNAMAFGDDVADISMFKAVKYSFAMGNGKDEVKDAASEVIEPVGEHGVANTLKKYGII